MPEELKIPAITVIVATYNRSDVLKFALESLLNQDFKDYEAWVIGDACTDDSEDVVRSFGDARLNWLNLPSNSGSQATPNNAGLQRARGEYIAYLGHDDLWLPSHLSSLLAFIEETGADLVHSLSALLDPAGVQECVGPPRKGTGYNMFWAPPSSWLHGSRLLEACGPWKDPTNLAWPVDVDFLRSAFLAGKTIRFCPRLTVLKFPSGWFQQAYSHKGSQPQGLYLERLQQDADAVERQVLLDLAIAYARNSNRGGIESWQAAFRRAVWVVLHQVRDIFARHWPLSVLVRWRFHRQVRLLRVKRGLSARRSERT